MLLETALRIHAQTIGECREQAAELIQYFERCRADGDPIRLGKARREMKKRLAVLEIYLYADPLSEEYHSDDDE